MSDGPASLHIGGREVAGRPQTSGPPPPSGLTSGEGDTRREDEPGAATRRRAGGRKGREAGRRCGGPSRPWEGPWARGVGVTGRGFVHKLPHLSPASHPLRSPVGQTPEGPPSKTWVGLQLLAMSVAPE